ncbi:MAG: histone deacetylase [Methylotenera sp.]|nr:histone deacetylase [Oligoflexia bacterium]
MDLIYWVRHLGARLRLRRQVGLWYHPDYPVKVLGLSARSLGIHVDRAEVAMSSLIQKHILKASDLHSSPLVSIQDLERVHSQDYLESTSRPEVLSRIFGLEPSISFDVDQLLKAQRRAVGGTLACAQAVVAGKYRIAVNLGGGFHHAEPERGAGFCVYNDVAVAIAVLRSRGYDSPIAIIDLDYHQGNGNKVAFAGDSSVHTLSLHGSVWTQTSAICNQDVLLTSQMGDQDYLNLLKTHLERVQTDFKPALVFYIAGNDVLQGDPLGDSRLTVQGVASRDQYVLGWIDKMNAVAVITLAGGYGPEAWHCTENLLRYLLIRDRKVRFQEIAESISPVDLQMTSEELATSALPDELYQVSEEDLLGDLKPSPSPAKILDYYSAHGIEIALERYGLLNIIRAQGFSDFKLEVDPSDPARQLVRLIGNQKVLAEVVVQKQFLAPPKGSDLHSSLEFLTVEWLLLQNPEAQFTPEKPRLPNQEHPGLGIAEEMQELFVQACHRLKLDGVLSRPAHFHNALVASKNFSFLEASAQGRFLGMRDALSKFGLGQASEKVEKLLLQTSDGKPLPWIAAEQVLPVSRRLNRYFHSRPYRSAVRKHRAELLKLGPIVRD